MEGLKPDHTTSLLFWEKIATHREQSRLFLAQAYEELARGDLPQASEKGWGAAAQVLKEIALERGWSNSKHRDINQAVWEMVRETGDDELSGLFSAASNLHVNFYDLEYPSHYISALLLQVERSVDKVEALLEPAA